MATSVITSRHTNHHKVPTGVIAGVVVTLAAFVGYFTLQNDPEVVRQSTSASSTYAGPTSALTGLIPNTTTGDAGKSSAAAQELPGLSLAEAIEVATAEALKAAGASVEVGPQAQSWNEGSGTGVVPATGSQPPWGTIR